MILKCVNLQWTLPSSLAQTSTHFERKLYILVSSLSVKYWPNGKMTHAILGFHVT